MPALAVLMPLSKLIWPKMHGWFLDSQFYPTGSVFYVSTT